MQLRIPELGPTPKNGSDACSGDMYHDQFPLVWKDKLTPLPAIHMLATTSPGPRQIAKGFGIPDGMLEK